jgi:hypothetical protein
MLRSGFSLLLLMATPIDSVAAKDHPVRVTTDSVAYCRELAERVASHPAATADEVRSLAAEGQALCDTGYVRTGIAKLRRALRAAQVDGN